MNKRNFARMTIFVFVILALLPGAHVKASDYPIGKEAMDYMDTLPLLRDLVICRELSTHDKKGGNDNGFTNKAEWVRREFGRRVAVMDAAGPGCLYSFWYSWPNSPVGNMSAAEPYWKLMLGKVRFFFDNEESPRISMPLRDLVGTEPHTYPIAIHADNSTGGYITYVPMSFQDGLRVSIGGAAMPMFFYHLWYHAYPLGTKIETWTGKEDLSKAAEQWMPEAAEKPMGPDLSAKKGLTIKPGESREIFRSGRGTIYAIRVKLARDDEALRSLWLKAWWDDDRHPSVEAPLSLLFAIENRFRNKNYEKIQNAPLPGPVVGMDSKGFFFLRLPMPFANKARLVIENRGQKSFIVDEVVIEHSPLFTSDRFDSACCETKSVGRLKTQFRENHELTPGRDYILAELSGRGHIAGTVLSVEDAPENFLEGDERVYTDGGRSPLVMGDATETYFNGSWYFFGQAFSCPLHGAPTFHVHDKGADVTMYRFHLTDFVPFRSGARFSIQHGGFNDVYGKYRSLVFYYGLPEKSLNKADYLNMTDEADLVAHNYSGAQPVRTRARDGFFEGDFNGQDLGLKQQPEWVSDGAWMLSLTVRGFFKNAPHNSPDIQRFRVAEHAEPYEFRVKVDPEAKAVMLRRLFDQSIFDQKARIEVDGKLAGVWFNTGNNKWKIWAEDDLILDPESTKGKSELRIRMIPESKRFSAVEYRVFSIVTPD